MKALLFADPNGSAVIQDVLRARGHEVEVFADEAEAWDAYQDGAHAMVVLGPGTRPHEALGLCRRLRALPKGRWTLVLAGLSEPPADALDAFWEAGADDFLVVSDGRRPLEARLAAFERRVAALSRRQDEEAAARTRLQLGQLIASLSTQFINVGADEIDRVIQRSLKAIGEFAGADRSYVYLFSPDGLEMNNTHEWCAPGVQPDIHNMQGIATERIPWSMERLRRFEVVQTSDARSLPPEAAAEREIMEAQGVEASVAVPLQFERALKGLLGFDMLRARGVWSETDIHLLKAVGDILINALERRRAEDALMKSEERFRRLMEHAADAFFVCDTDGKILDVNQRACESLGYTRGELLAKRLGDTEQGSALDGALAGARGAAPATVQTVQRRRDGSSFPAEARLGAFEEGGRALALVLVRDITDRAQHRVRLETLNKTFLGLSGDIAGNIRALTEACGELLGAACALYSRMEDGFLCAAGRWKVPADFPDKGPVDGLICQDVIEGHSGPGVYLVEDLPGSRYAATDPYVKAFGLKVYAGHPVLCRGKTMGSLCVLYTGDMRFGDDLKRLLEIFSAAIGVEEERRLAQEDLRSSEERFRQVTESIREVFWLSDREKSEMIYISPAYEEIWGRSMESLYRQPKSWLDAILPEDRARVFDAALTKQAEGAYDEEYRIFRPDGSIRWIRDRAFPIRNGEGKVYRIAGIAEDVTERKRMEREVVEISGREQRRIGQDLHDGLGQTLTGIAFLSKALQERLAAKDLAEAGDLEKIVWLVNEAIAHTKGLGRGLYPVELETNGLASALQELAAQTEAVFKIPCAVHVDAAAVEALDADTEVNLYRIAQEALTNAVKHGKARQIDLSVFTEDGKTTLAVTDDGVGVGDAPPAEGMGLRIMNYRAKVIGASLALRRSRGGGTVVACTVARKP